MVKLAPYLEYYPHRTVNDWEQTPKCLQAVSTAGLTQVGTASFATLYRNERCKQIGIGRESEPERTAENGWVFGRAERQQLGDCVE